MPFLSIIGVQHACFVISIATPWLLNVITFYRSTRTFHRKSIYSQNDNHALCVQMKFLVVATRGPQWHLLLG